MDKKKATPRVKKKVAAKTATRKAAKKKKRVTTSVLRTSAKPSRGTANALDIIDRKYYAGKPKRQAQLEQARTDDEVDRRIYQLRNDAGISQRELAKMVGTTASVICRLEDADYKGHSLPMLRRIAAAFDKRVEIRFVSVRKKALA